MLFAFATAQRCQTLSLLQTSDITFMEDRAIIHVKQVLKQTRPGLPLTSLVLPRNNIPDNCAFQNLAVYLDRTNMIRSEECNNLFISFVKPHGKVSSSTISRWIKIVMALAGIDTSVFSAHSTRAASVSKVHSRNLPIDIILNTAGWSNAKTFQKFYNRNTVDTSAAFANILFTE
jgi:integrase